MNRLIQASGAYGVWTYNYDSIGNMTSKEGVNYSYGQSGAKPHAVTLGTDGFSAIYDANGNMTATNNSSTLTYDYDNRLSISRYEGLFSAQSVTLEVPLTKGWNFVSLPLIVDDPAISVVFSSIAGKYTQVSRYNPATKKFEYFVPEYTQWTTLETAKGYQVNVASDCILKITGKIPNTNYSSSLVSGWQMLGYPSKNRVKLSDGLSNLIKGTHYDRISRYDKTTNTFVDLASTDYLEPGMAYFIRMLKNSTWTILPKAVVTVTEFVYDAAGNRVKKLVNGAATIYIDELYEIQKTEDGSQKSVKHIFAGANRIASVSSRASPTGGEAISYYHGDHLGSSNVITDKDGKQSANYEYTPYGSLVSQSAGQPVNPLTGSPVHHLFTGKELDSTNLYYYGARYYDPRIGRFITPDPINQNLYDPQNLNSYTYCRNNPINLIDPTGESWKDSWDRSRDFWRGFPFTNPTPSQLGFSDALYKGIVSSSTAILGVALLPQAIISSPFISSLWDTAGIIGSASLGLSAGAAITGRTLTGRSISDYERGEQFAYTALGWGTLAWGAGSQYKETGKIFDLLHRDNGLIVYRRGTFAGNSNIKGGQWAPENPLSTPNYARKYGLPAENSGIPDWIVKGRVIGKYGQGSATRSYNNSANTGGATEIRPNNPNDVQLDWFYMPEE